MKKILIMTSLSIIASCGGTTYWVKPGATDADFNRDYDICMQRGWSAGPGNPLIAHDVSSRCMRQKGWTPERRKDDF